MQERAQSGLIQVVVESKSSPQRPNFAACTLLSGNAIHAEGKPRRFELYGTNSGEYGKKR